jgi:hypothetical protein
VSAATLSRVERARMPLAKDVVRAVAIDHGVCVRPVPVRQTDLTTGETRIVDVPCGATFASKCPPCAEKARRLRVVQCREGWHLDHEPDLTPDDPTERQRALVEERAELVELREKVAAAGGNVPAVDAVLAECDEEIAAAGVRGTLPSGEPRPRRVRSTRRRSDAPDLPRRRVSPTTLGRVFEGRDGRTFRPSLFLTLTLDSYGRVRSDGTPVDPDSYDYRRAARDALHFSKLVDRFVQNLRRFVGWDVQYFATVEPQRRLAPHLHMAIRGTISRAELRQVVAATYAQVWWPPCDTPVYTGTRLPTWDDESQSYVDPDTAEPLPTWDDALDAIGDDTEPVHVARFGPVLDVQGVLAGTPDADGACATSPSTSPKPSTNATPPTPTRSGHTPPSSSTPCGTSHARRRARTGCATASNPRTPAPGCGRGTAGPRHTAPNTSATPAAACSSPASGRPRTSPTTAPTDAPTSSPCSPSTGRTSTFRQPATPAATPGNPPPPTTPTYHPSPTGSCAPSANASAGNTSTTPPKPPVHRPT